MNIKLLHFYVDQSGPYPFMLETLEAFSLKHQNIQIEHVDSELKKDIVNQYQVEYVPTVVVLADNKEYGRITRAIDETELNEIINSITNP